MAGETLHYAGAIYDMRIAGSGSSGMEPSLDNALRRLRNEFKFSDGFATVKPSGDALRAFEESIYWCSTDSLVKALQHLFQYEIVGNSLYSHIGELTDKNRVEIEKQLMLEKMLRIAQASCAGKYRLNGDEVIRHWLEGALFVAAVYAPQKPGDRLALVEVVSALLHDIVEDVEAGDIPSFRVPASAGRETELHGAREIYSYLKSELGDYYGGETARVLRAITRPPKKNGIIYALDENIDAYLSYYGKVNRAGPRALIPKAGDGNSNKVSVLSIMDENVKFAKKESVIYKIIPQILVWDRLAYVIREILLYGYREVAVGTRYDFDSALRAPTAEDAAYLKRGYAILGSRVSSPHFLQELPKSGIPMAIIFNGAKLEISLQFCNSPDDVKGIIQGALGLELVNISMSRKIIPSRVDNEIIVSLNWPKVASPESLAKKLVPAYDDYLRGSNLEIFHSFNRRHKAEAALEASKRVDPSHIKSIERFRLRS